MLDLEGLKKAGQRRFAEVETSIGTVRVRSLSEHERNTYELSYVKDDGKPDRAQAANLRARFIALCLVDESGNRIVDDEKSLLELDAGVIGELYDVCSEHCRIDKDATEEIKELEKNSGETPGA